MSLKSRLLIIAGLLFVASVFFGALQFKEQVGQTCHSEYVNYKQGEYDTFKRINWVWQWWNNRHQGKAFAACIGPRDYVVYRPLDIAALGILVSAGIAAIAFGKQKKFLAR